MRQSQFTLKKQNSHQPVTSKAQTPEDECVCVCMCGVFVCLFVLTKHTWFLPNAHLVYHQTLRLQHGSLNSRETSIISNVLTTKLISLHLVFGFPASLHPRQQLWYREHKHISPLNIHQLELRAARRRPGRPHVCPSFRVSPFGVWRKGRPSDRKRSFKQPLFIQQHQERRRKSSDWQFGNLTSSNLREGDAGNG